MRLPRCKLHHINNTLIKHELCVVWHVSVPNTYVEINFRGNNLVMWRYMLLIWITCK